MARLTRGRGHTYRIDGQRVPSVTGIKKMLDKPQLIAWAARMSAGYAIDHWDELTDKPMSERYRLIEDARFAPTREARESGKRIHHMAEQLAMGGEAKPDPEHRRQVDAVARFLDRWDMTTVAAECAVGNTDYLYAGMFDTINTSPKLGQILIDWKTSAKGPYQDDSLQLAGYRYCNVMLRKVELIGPRGGVRAGYDEEPMPQVDGTYIVKILPDDVELYPVRTNPADFQYFLFLRELWDWNEMAKESKSDSYDPPIDEPTGCFRCGDVAFVGQGVWVDWDWPAGVEFHEEDGGEAVTAGRHVT